MVTKMIWVWSFRFHPMLIQLHCSCVCGETEHNVMQNDGHVKLLVCGQTGKGGQRQSTHGLSVFISKIEDKGYKIQDTRYRIHNIGYRIQDIGYRTQATQYRIHNTRYEMQNIKYRTQNSGYRIQDIEHRIQDLVQRHILAFTLFYLYFSVSSYLIISTYQISILVSFCCYDIINNSNLEKDDLFQFTIPVWVHLRGVKGATSHITISDKSREEKRYASFSMVTHFLLFYIAMIPICVTTSQNESCLVN